MFRDLDTDKLLKTARTGDLSAVSELLDRHRDRLRQMVRVRMDTRLASRVDPSDVVQETLAKGAARLPEYLQSPSLEFYPWLRQIAHDCLVDLQRRHAHAGKRTVTKEEQLALSDASAVALAQRLFTKKGGPLSHLLREELLARTRQAMQGLSASDREVLTLRHLEELSTKETAAVLGVSESVIKVRLLRAVQRLRELLELESTD